MPNKKPKDKLEVKTKRQRKQKQVKKQPIRLKDEEDLTGSDSDELKSQTKKVKGGDADRGKPTEIRTKRQQGQVGLTDVKLGGNKRKKQDEDEDEKIKAINRLTKKPRVEFVNTGKVEKCIRDVFNKVGKKLVFKYKAEDQSAETTLTVGKATVAKKTTNNKHAEMGVLEDALTGTKPLLTITKDGNIAVNQGKNPRKLKPNEFKTRNANNKAKKMDHCGYCTFFLTLMDVPTEQPTFQPSRFTGSQNAADVLPYPLPDPIRKHPAIIAKALGFKDASEFVNETKEGIEGYYFEANRTDKRVRKTSSQEDIFEKLKIKDFTTWNDTDKADAGAEERFSSLLDKVFLRHKDEFVNSLWRPVEDELTNIMKKDEKTRAAFLKKTTK
jgi:hypothetical protein